METITISPIAHIHTDFPGKFGIPRQSGLVPELEARIVFEPEYRNPEALRGIREYSYLWLIWGFSENKYDRFHATVKPPRLGGEKRGVFATRSPFRPNGLGLSSVRLVDVEEDPNLGSVLIVTGADLMDGTPIYDIKPYVPYADAHPDAAGSFGEAHKTDRIRVICPEELLKRIPESKRDALIRVLELDPRASYEKQPDYVYGLAFDRFEIRFTADSETLTVTDILPAGTAARAKS